MCTSKWLLYFYLAKNYLQNEYQHDMVQNIMSKICQLLFQVIKTSLVSLCSIPKFGVTATNWKAIFYTFTLGAYLGDGPSPPPPQQSKFYFRYRTKPKKSPRTMLNFPKNKVFKRFLNTPLCTMVYWAAEVTILQSWWKIYFMKTYFQFIAEFLELMVNSFLQ